MNKFRHYWRLMRCDKPIGTLLLWFPTAWALWIANEGVPPFRLLVYFFLGTIIMRALGCIINDMTDNAIDKQVTRTKFRPLAAGTLRMREAIGCAMCLMVVAFWVVLQLPIACFWESVIAFLITMIYPLGKRFIEAPQLILGIAFSMGIPMAYSASFTPFNSLMWVLFIINYLWILSYDTIYAMADRDDDIAIGVHSMAVLLGSYDRVFIVVTQILFHGLWLYVAYALKVGIVFYFFWGIAIFFLIQQQRLLSRQGDMARYIRAFSLNGWYGACMWLALILQFAFSHRL